MNYPSWDEGHRRRVRAIILGASTIMIVLGLGWCAAFIFAGRLPLALLHAVMVFAGIGLLWLILRGRARSAAIIEANLLPLFIGVFCLFDEVPPGVPRATHLHFLAVAIGCYFVFRLQGAYLKYVVPAACLIAFAVFQNVDLCIHGGALTIPHEVAWIGGWANTLTAVLGLVLIVVVMNADLTVRHMMEVEIRRAIAKGDFRLVYQPQVDEQGRLVGAEALIRWQHASMGNIPPDTFIPLAEETGLIVPIGNWVLRAACAQLALWQGRPETAQLTLAINVSASQFLQPDFVRSVEEIVRISRVDTRRLKFELTESMFVDDIEATVSKMTAIREFGIVWSLDDFGTGYSSLSVLHRFPLGEVKIDRSFVGDLPANRSNAMIIEAIITLAERLGLQVIAEGVETKGQLDHLRAVGHLVYQGYLFGPPMEIDAFEAHRSHRSREGLQPAVS